MSPVINMKDLLDTVRAHNEFVAQQFQLVFNGQHKNANAIQHNTSAIERTHGAISGLRDEVHNLYGEFNEHRATSDLKHLGHDRERAHLISDISGLKGDVSAVEKTGRQFAIVQAQDEVRIEHEQRLNVRQDETALEQKRANRAYVIAIAGALLGATLALLVQILMRAIG